MKCPLRSSLDSKLQIHTKMSYYFKQTKIQNINKNISNLWNKETRLVGTEKWSMKCPIRSFLGLTIQIQQPNLSIITCT